MSSQEIWKAQANYGRQKTDLLNDSVIFHRLHLKVSSLCQVFGRYLKDGF